VWSETVEMPVEYLDVSTFQGRIKDRFPKILRIDLLWAAAEELDQVMDAIRGAVGKCWCIVAVSMHSSSS
jgi:hypothetical protein